MEQKEEDISAAAETLGSLDSRRGTVLSVSPSNDGVIEGNMMNQHNNGEGVYVDIVGMAPSNPPLEPRTIASFSEEIQESSSGGSAARSSELTEGAFYHAPATGSPFAEWNQKEWNELVQDILIFLNEKDPTESRLFHNERQLLPDNFESVVGTICYPYKGTFLPSGHADGRVWKPSQGAKLTGNWMMKRYFYHKDPSTGNRAKRQVSWINGRENWNFIEYRSNAKGKVKLEELMANQSWIDWPTLLTMTSEHMRTRERVPPAGISVMSKTNEEGENGKKRGRRVNSNGTDDAIKKAKKLLKEFGANGEPMEYNSFDHQGAFQQGPDPNQEQNQENDQETHDQSQEQSQELQSQEQSQQSQDQVQDQSQELQSQEQHNNEDYQPQHTEEAAQSLDSVAN